LVARRTARKIFSISGMSRRRLLPPPWRTTFLTGQPMLMSMMSAPASSTMTAEAAIRAGSAPNICTAMGRSLSSKRVSGSERARLRVIPSVLTSSDTTRPQPPSCLTAMRKRESVCPASGASTRGGEITTSRILNMGAL